MPRFLVLRYRTGRVQRLALAPLRHAGHADGGGELLGTLQLPIGIRVEEGDPVILRLPSGQRLALPQIVAGAAQAPGVSFSTANGDKARGMGGPPPGGGR